MSYEIYYGKQFIKVGREYIPMIYIGSNNCYEIKANGREVRERSWHNDRYVTGGDIMANKETIINKIEELRSNIIESNNNYLKNNPNWDIYDDKKFGYFSSISMYGKHTSTTTYGMFKGLYLTGIKQALTIEELIERGVMVKIYSGSDYENKLEKLNKKDFIYYPRTTEQLLDNLKMAKDYLEGTGLNFYLSLNLDEKGLKNLRRYFTKPKEKKKSEVTEYFLINIINYGFFVKKTKYGFKYQYYKDFGKKFYKKNNVERTLKKLKLNNPKLDFSIEKFNLEKPITV